MSMSSTVVSPGIAMWRQCWHHHVTAVLMSCDSSVDVMWQRCWCPVQAVRPGDRYRSPLVICTLQLGHCLHTPLSPPTHLHTLTHQVYANGSAVPFMMPPFAAGTPIYAGLRPVKMEGADWWAHLYHMHLSYLEGAMSSRHLATLS